MACMVHGGCSLEEWSNSMLETMRFVHIFCCMLIVVVAGRDVFKQNADYIFWEKMLYMVNTKKKV